MDRSDHLNLSTLCPLTDRHREIVSQTDRQTDQQADIHLRALEVVHPLPSHKQTDI